MATKTARSHEVNVGHVFTPFTWAEWLVDRWGIFDAWVGGASVCDPTAGQGVFALALFKVAKSRGVQISTELLSRLVLIEICSSHLQNFKSKALRDFGINFPASQMINSDVINVEKYARYDILFGNPPWENFTNLPEFYKEKLKKCFVSEGLIPNKQKALLGSSRVDIAALIMKVALGRMLHKDGIGCFYLPLSLFSGDDAHRGFRDYVANHRKFAVEEVYEFTTTKVFKGINTSYCCAKFRMDSPHKFPVKYFKELRGNWIEHRAFPLKDSDDQWRVLGQKSTERPRLSIEIKLHSDQNPRQGANTCGANSIFIFENKPSYLPDRFLFPLATKEIWKTGDMTSRRWILLPYNRDTGKPLLLSDMEKYPRLSQYLAKARDKLERRRGVLIQSSIGRGFWWSLLGVGPYSFAPYKVVWEAYGKRHFCPVILDDEDGQVWQANQAMHAFIPCWSKSDALRIESALRHPEIPVLLRQINGEGKCNWAQPGKIKKILSMKRS